MSKFKGELDIIENAKRQIAIFRNIAHVAKLPWREPYVTSSVDGHVVLEWWYSPRKLTVYVQADVAEYVKSWGASMDEQMEDGILIEYVPLWAWLTT